MIMKKIVFLITLACISDCIYSQISTTTSITKLEEYLEACTQTENFSGAVLVAKNGKNSAKSVFVSGEFNNWIPWQTFLTKQGDRWLCKVHLNQGTYKYMFVVDGNWISDPDNPLQDRSSFTSSLITVH